MKIEFKDKGICDFSRLNIGDMFSLNTGDMFLDNVLYVKIDYAYGDNALIVSLLGTMSIILRVSNGILKCNLLRRLLIRSNYVYYNKVYSF